MNARSKVYVEGPRPDIQVPFTEVALSGGEPPVRLYDTSGPGSDPEVGLPKLREAWIAERRDAAASRLDRDGTAIECPTQLHYAKQGIVTPEMEYVASAKTSPPSSCATRSPPAAPYSPRTSTTPRPSR